MHNQAHPHIGQSLTWVYTEDLPGTAEFYAELLGLEQVFDQGACRIFRTAPDAFLGVRCAAQPLLLFQLVLGGGGNTLGHPLAHGGAHRDHGERRVLGDLRCELQRVVAQVGLVGEHVREFVQRSIEQAKGRADDELNRIQGVHQTDVQKHRATVRGALERFLLSAHVDVIESRYKIRLEDGTYNMFAVCELPRGLGVAYRLAATRLPEWHVPRKVGDLVGEMELQVGMK